MKICTLCGATKPLGEFNRNSRNKDGRAYYCRPCSRQKAKESRERHPDAVRQRNAKYGHENREALREYHRQRYEENREAHIAKTRVWHQENRYSLWEIHYRRRCERMGINPVIERFNLPDVVERYGDSCFYCETGEFEHLDHAIPVSKGGPHTLDNVRPSCAGCNLTKSDKTETEWLAEQAELDDLIDAEIDRWTK